MSVDGRDPSSEPLDKLVKRLRGAPGSHVKLGVRRTGVRRTSSRSISSREIIHVPSVAFKLLDGSVAYVRIKQFQERTHDELLAAAAKLRARAGGHIGGVMLDLRSDPGGLVDQAAEVADEFLDGGVIYTTRHRGQVVDEVTARGRRRVRRRAVRRARQPVHRERLGARGGRAPGPQAGDVVGERTFGKGSVQSIVSLPGGAGMRLTIARYYTPSGHAIQADGVHPDVMVEAKKEDGAVTFRERDLEGHLAPEARVAQATNVGRVVVLGSDAGTEPVETTGREAKGVPRGSGERKRRGAEGGVGDA